MLPSATESRINAPSAPKSSQNPEYKGSCGSGKKYKNCCEKVSKTYLETKMDKKNIVFLMLFRGLEHCHSDNAKKDIIIIKGDSDE